MSILFHLNTLHMGNPTERFAQGALGNLGKASRHWGEASGGALSKAPGTLGKASGYMGKAPATWSKALPDVPPDLLI